MNEETIIENNAGNKPASVKVETEKAVTGEKPTATPKAATKNEEAKEEEKKEKISKGSVAGIAGLGAVIGATANLVAAVLKPMELFPDMFGGGSDVVVDESESTEAPAPNVNLVGHDMDVAESVNDSMSFNQAFAAARHEVGAGGLFVWHGHTYGTYYANEWDAMTPEEHDQYWADVHHTTANIEYEPEDMAATDEVPADIENTVDPLLADEEQNTEEEAEVDETPAGTDGPIAEDEEVVAEVTATVDDQDIEENEVLVDIEEVSGEETGDVTEVVVEPVDGLAESDVYGPDGTSDVEVYETFDLDGDGTVDAAIVDANGNDMPDIVIDTTGDGQIDTLILDPEVDDNGDLTFSEENVFSVADVPTDEVEETFVDEPVDDMLGDDTLTENPDVDDFASMTPDPDIPIDNDMDMSEFA